MDAFDWMLAQTKKRMRNALKKTADEVSYMIQEAYTSSIDAFYDSYDPRWYDRTGATYEASDYHDTNGIISVGSGGDSYEVGIRVDPSRMGAPYKKNTAWVFDRTFNQGIHGITDGYFAGAVYGQFKSKYVGYGTDLGSYAIPPITTPPASLMDEKFQDIQGKIPGIFESYM